MTTTTKLFVFIGLLAATALFIWQGVSPVFSSFADAGWGILVVAGSHFVSMTFNARAWQIILPESKRPSTLFFLWAVWLREAVNGLLPVARIGGEIVTGRLLIERRITASLSIGSLIVDITISLASQFVFTLIGISCLLLAGHSSAIQWNIIVVLFVAITVIVLLIWAQKTGAVKWMSLISAKLFKGRFDHMIGTVEEIDIEIGRLYGRRYAIFFCGIWQLLGWTSGALEIWLALYYLKHPISVPHAIAVESLIQAVSSCAFVIPGALGVQEGAFIMAGTLIGLPAELSLAVALMRRSRDILMFLPALAFWQARLGWRLSNRRS